MFCCVLNAVTSAGLQVFCSTLMWAGLEVELPERLRVPSRVWL